MKNKVASFNVVKIMLKMFDSFIPNDTINVNIAKAIGASI